MRLLEDAHFGVCTFFGLSEDGGGDRCGANGLPLTPASIRMIGRFQFLKTLEHPSLCKYLEFSRGKYDRVFITSEHYFQNLSDLFSQSPEKRAAVFPKIAYQLASATEYLHEMRIVNRNLCAKNVLLNSTESVRLTGYGLYYTTKNCTDVSFPLGDFYYLPPEFYCSWLLGKDPRVLHSTTKTDIWSIGVLLLELLMGCRFCDLWTRTQFRRILDEAVNDECQTSSFLDVFLSKATKNCTICDIPEAMRDMVRSCLQRMPSSRPSATMLISKYFREFSSETIISDGLDAVFLNRNRSAHLSVETAQQEVERTMMDAMDSPVRLQPIDEVYALWKLAGSNIETILKKEGLIKDSPPILCLPNLTVDEFDMYGNENERRHATDLTIISLSSANLFEKLAPLSTGTYFPVLELMFTDVDGNNNSNENDTLVSAVDASQLPIIVKERDILYQMQRMIMFHRLIEAYPYRRELLWKLAVTDIPPYMRGYIWAILLDVNGPDIGTIYDSIDKESSTPTDRQIEVDVPRCHQYDELMSSPDGHAKLKRLLKAWVNTNHQYVYWQGLDSLCAPFLYLHFCHESIAFACLSNFIPKYLNNFFLKDNSAVIQEYLAVFNHLLAFHDPVLYTHLANIGFTPELYAIPWFLTMFAHVFPLQKLFHLWDTLLLGSDSFPLCVGVAILVQLRDRLLEYGFNECILLFSDMPDVDIEHCVTVSVELFRNTPKSAFFRKNMALMEGRRTSGSFTGYSVDFVGVLGMEPSTVQELKQLNCPRICAEELLLLSGVHERSVNWRDTLLAVDIRGADEFAKGAFPKSINIPYNSCFSGDSFRLPANAQVEKLLRHKGRLTVVIGGKDKRSDEFATQLTQKGFGHVCVLFKGVDVLRHTNILALPANDNT